MGNLAPWYNFLCVFISLQQVPSFLFAFLKIISDAGLSIKNRLSLYTSLGTHQAGAYPGFRSVKQLGVLLLPPGWDASPSQGYPQQ